MLKLGKAIRIVRQAKGLRLSQVAKNAVVSLPFLSLIENGDREPSLAVLRRLAGALDVPSEALILLAQSGEGKLSTTDEKANDLVESIRKLAEIEDALRAKLGDGRSENDP